jgi:hypothetical protein
MVCKLKKFLYGLKQSPHEWNHKINAYFLFQKFERDSTNHNVYFFKTQEIFYVIITLYVDDLILASNELTLLKETKGNLSKKFEMVDLGEI